LRPNAVIPYPTSEDRLAQFFAQR